MSTALMIAFLFYCGAIMGWCIEFIFRNLFSHKGPRGKYFINPGLCKGPWLPIYGVGVAVMFIITWKVSTKLTFDSPIGHVVVILSIAVIMVLIELIGGLFLLKVLNLRLWDYRNQKGNFMGVICPKFTLVWAGAGAAYYLFLHKSLIDDVIWLSENLAFSFVVGLFWGVFIIDLITSSRYAAAMKKYGDDHDVIIKYEELKALLVQKEKEYNGKQTSFITQGKKNLHSIEDTMVHATDALEKKKEKK